MNLVHELEIILQQPHFMGNDKTGCNLAINEILDKIEELGLEIVHKNTDKC